MDKTIQAPALQSTITAILTAAGSLPAEAEEVAANLVLANLSGHDSHGVGMVPRYIELLTELPTTVNQKVEKFRLKQLMEAGLDKVWDREKSGIVLKR